MPQIYLCFVWHMHQPFYKDLISGEYHLPWTRMHALKDYYGMVKLLDGFPGIHQTFNLVPSLMLQIEEYASGRAVDPFLRAALKPAEELTSEEQSFILQYFFHANLSRMIYRYPRYGELWDAWQRSGRNPKHALRFFGMAEFRDLQVLSQLAWFDEEDFSEDAEIRGLVEKGDHFSAADQALIGRKETEALRRVLPTYRDFASRGQVEISTTPYYHPILPLLCDTNIAEISHPYVALPQRFCYPEDAREQIARAREFVAETFGTAPAGMWPSEGSVSDDALRLAAETGFQWAASDNGVLSRTIHKDGGPANSYRPYEWSNGHSKLRLIFRDHHLSDLIGFIYSRMEPADAAGHFLTQIRNNCRDLLAQGRDALVPIILDGENAWEYYDRNGRPFLAELYHRIQQDPHMAAVTVSEALRRIDPAPMDHIFPGSWINSNFDVWIGAEEDNQAWEYLLRARRTYDQVVTEGGRNLPPDRLHLAHEELLIAEGSDWNWWYGPEHGSANRPEFDRLYRAHLANVYRALCLEPPTELSRPILKVTMPEMHDPPSGPIRATIDGEVSSYFEWLGAGLYQVDSRSGAMHGQRFVVSELRYGSDGSNLFIRLDFVQNMISAMQGAVVILQAAPMADVDRVKTLSMRLDQGRRVDSEGGGEHAFAKIFEARIPLSWIGAAILQPVRFHLSLWQDGLPLDAVPQQGWLEVSTTEPSEWGF
jgi:alpha-amylase/alpha-mannosidase (GH57 family)